ncbi:MAG: glycosyl hydrolase family 18 protein [bacterium]
MKYLLFFLLTPIILVAQSDFDRKSIHQLENELHQSDTVKHPETVFAASPLLLKGSATNSVRKIVYGWHPYWASSSAYLSYDYQALSHIALFSYETDDATGGYKTIRSWETTPIIAYAHERGVKVTLTVTNFGYDQNDKLLSDTVKQQKMITTLISLLQSRNGDSVNFDLESVRNAQRNNLVSFMRRAATQIKAQLPNAEISMATPAVDWSGTWDFAQMAQICDYLIVMGYDYYWSGSATAGPVAPLDGENYNVTRTVETYLANGVPPQKLLLGVPWFGFDWPVQSSVRKSPATSTASSRTYTVAETMASTYGKNFDQLTKVPWFSYQSGSVWRQVWYDDSLSLAMKYSLVNARSLGGIGIWALSYDGGRQEIWNGIKSSFTATTGTIESRQSEGNALLQNYPNPFNGTTRILYTVQKEGWVNLNIYDLLGREVAALVHELKRPGTYSLLFNSENKFLSSAVYLCRFTSGSVTWTNKMILTK